MQNRLASLGIFLLASVLLASGPALSGPADFQQFLAGLWPAAKALGVSRAQFDAATADIAPDPQIIQLAGRQPEFARPIGAYLAATIPDSRVQAGIAKERELQAELAAIERRFGVDRHIVVAVWGLETNFGESSGNKNVVRSLATLAFIGYRGDFFRNELLTALKILQDQHLKPSEMTGSWAGAMGQAQFLPSSFERYAVDFTGDGEKDIWRSAPDALASIANYLKSMGWAAGQKWGFEIKLPAGYDLTRSHGTFAEWKERGVRRADGGDLPSKGQATLFHPSGIEGPAFLVADNFSVIKSYNDSDAYALGVANLADRMAGGAAFVTAWPSAAPLTKSERMAVQRALSARGFPATNSDGRIDLATREVVRRFQAAHGLTADGNPDKRLLDYLTCASERKPADNRGAAASPAVACGRQP